MKPFIMFKLDSFDGYTSNGAGVGGRVTTRVRFIAMKVDGLNLPPIGGDEEIYDGSFTGILRGVIINDDGTRGRMFFDDGVEIIYDPENLPKL